MSDREAAWAAHNDARERLGLPRLPMPDRPLDRPPPHDANAPPGPGAVLHRWLSSRPARLLGFGPAEGCSCSSDAAAMDAAGVAGVLADLDAWTDRLARKPQAANVPRRAIRWAIRRACRAAAAAHHHHES